MSQQRLLHNYRAWLGCKPGNEKDSQCELAVGILSPRGFAQAHYHPAHDHVYLGRMAKKSSMDPCSHPPATSSCHAVDATQLEPRRRALPAHTQ